MRSADINSERILPAKFVVGSVDKRLLAHLRHVHEALREGQCLRYKSGEFPIMERQSLIAMNRSRTQNQKRTKRSANVFCVKTNYSRNNYRGLLSKRNLVDSQIATFQSCSNALRTYLYLAFSSSTQ